MKNLIIAVLCFLPTLVFCQGTINDLEQLRYLKEVEWPKAYRTQDTVLLDRILADEFQMIDAQGNWYTKKDELAYIKTHKPNYESFRFEIKRLEVFENNTAVISGIGHIKGSDKEGAYQTTYHSSNILIKRGAIWKAINSHVSGINTTYHEKKE